MEPQLVDISSLANNHVYSDLVITIGLRKWFAHKAILSLRAKIFQKLIKHDNILDLTNFGVTEDEFDYIYAYIYGIKHELNSNTIKAILIRLKFEAVIDNNELVLLIEKMDIEDIASLWNYIFLTNNKEIYNKFLNRILSDNNMLVRKRIMDKYPQLILEFLKSDINLKIKVC